ncbi:IMP cyclohydrolase [Lacticaseibacillus paracasei]|nr:IMP cyclohydrolase [Lacticaseibacillus paracasei]PCL34266.1 IMP cyclohydrolase [Lacticaseibacillus paracasei]
MSRYTRSRSPAQKHTCKDLDRNGQNPAITLLTETRSQAQKPECKDLGRNDPNPAITPEAAYTQVSKRACERSDIKI